MTRAGIDYNTIIRAAAALADAQGLESVTLAAVAAKLNVRTPSLYNHIGGMPGLRRGLALAGIGELEERLGRAAMGRSGDDAIRAIAAAHLNFARSRPGLYEASVSAPDPADGEIREVAQRIVDILLQVLQHYKLEGEEAVHVVRGLRSIAHGFASLESKGDFSMAPDKDESFAKLVELFIQGLHAGLQR